MVVDDLGRSINLANRPQRLVSLVPNLSELVHVLGRGADLVGVTDFCVEPADGFRHAARVRGTKNPDRALINRLAPDLVLANDEENRKYDVEQLEALGVTVYVTCVRTIADVADVVARVSQLLGCADAGVRIAAEIRRVPATNPVTRPRVFCPIWRDGAGRGEAEKWWCVGPETYAGQLLQDAGFALVAGSSDPRYPQLSLAEVKAAQPDLVLLPDEPYNFGDDDAAVFATWPQVTVMPYPGTDLFWWGSRTPDARRALRGLL